MTLWIIKLAVLHRLCINVVIGLYNLFGLFKFQIVLQIGLYIESKG